MSIFIGFLLYINNRIFYKIIIENQARGHSRGRGSRGRGHDSCDDRSRSGGLQYDISWL